MPLVRLLVLALILGSFPLGAQDLAPFGEPYPLANTRYVPVRENTSDFFAPDAPVLRTNGTDAFLFLNDTNGVRVVRVDESPRIARVVLPFAVTSDYLFDAVWTGSHFLVVATDRERSYELWGRLVTATGEPVGEPFLVGSGLFAALAFNGRYVLLIHSDGGENQSTVLLSDGTPSQFTPQELPNSFSTDRAAVATNGSRFAALMPAGGFSEPAVVLFDENGQILQQQALADPQILNWAMASDGDRFLVVGALAGRARSWLFDHDGALIGMTELVDKDQTYFYRDPLVVWSGSRWVMTRVASNEGQVLELDAQTREIVSTSWVDNTQVSLGVLDGTVIGAWWANRQTVAGTFPFQEGRTPVAVEAAAQRLMATAVSSYATLFVWNEHDDLRAGVRMHDGRWRERVIGPGSLRVLAASSGEEFMVIVGDQVLRLDGSGELLPASTIESAPFQPTAMVWNGAHYGVIGYDSEDRTVTAALTPFGWSAPAILPPPELPTERQGVPLLSSSGGQFLAAWSVFECPLECMVRRIETIPLSSSLEPAGPVSVAATSEETINGAFALGWNGVRHILAYATSSAIRAREIDSAGIPGDRRDVVSQSSAVVRILSMDHSTIIQWADLPTLSFRGITMEQSGALSPSVLIHELPSLTELGGFLTTFPDGRLAFAFYSAQQAAPHHGSLHLMLSVAGAAPSLVPEAPQASLLSNVLAWSRPAGEILGYRIEQRNGDGEWMEHDRWFDPEERSFAVPGVIPGMTFRVRAFSNAGPGPYSPVRPNARRRAVRSGF